MTLGERIKSARRECGMTQKDLADKTGMTYQQISQYERNERRPKLETLQRIAVALGCYVADLMPNGDWANVPREDLIESWEAPLPGEFDRLTGFYQRLNPTGQRIAVERVEELTKIPEYQRKEDDFPQDEG